ncbi:MAG: inositol monophosphatase family protein [Methylotetracoccus sp.]
MNDRTTRPNQPDADPALPDILRTAVAIATGAGAILREGLEAIRGGRAAGPRYKTTNIDPVTEYDLRSEAHIVEALQREFPTHTIIGEEGGRYRTSGASGEVGQRYLWQVDPLDGTVNFAHGFPMFCVSLGLLIDGIPAVGVVFNPATDELFAAAAGHRATRNGMPIAVSQTNSLDKALLITGFSYDTHVSDSNMRNFLGFQHTAQATRRIGSAALNLCYTAAGQMDGHWELKVQPHDIAAGIAIVREAGGMVTDFDGGNDMLGSGRIVASNGLIHDAMLAVLIRMNDRD